MDDESQSYRRVTWVEVIILLTIIGLPVALWLTFMPRLQERANRQACARNLRDIGLAIHNFHATYGYFPNQGSWYGHGTAYDAANQPLSPKYQTAGWAMQILPFLELDSLYRTSDVLYSGGKTVNIRPIGPRGSPPVLTPFPDQYAPRNSYYVDLTTGLVGPFSSMPIKVYYCPSRRRPDWHNPAQAGRTDYTAVVPGMAPMSRDRDGNPNEDTAGLVHGWSSAEGRTVERPGYNDWQYGRHHGVIPGGNWGKTGTKHTFASVTDGVSQTMMVGEKILPPSQYSGGSPGDSLGPFSGAGPDTVRTSATGLPWPVGGPPHGVGHVNPSRDRDEVDGWVFAMGFGSAHPDGIRAVFVDGSVRTIRYGIDPEVFNALGNIDDGTRFESDTTDWDRPVEVDR